VTYYKAICLVYQLQISDCMKLECHGKRESQSTTKVVKQTLLFRRHVSTPVLGHHQVSKKVSYEETMQFRRG
jgi:hypothetical protein